MAGLALKLSNGITIQSGYFKVAFSFANKRYKVTTIYKAEQKNIKIVAKFLANIKTDLEREQFYLSNYRKYLKRPEALYNLDETSMPSRKDVLLHNLLLDQFNNYQSIYSNGNLAISTLTDYTGIINNHLIPFFGHLKLGELTIQHIEQFLLNLKLSKKRLSIVLIPLKVIFHREFKLEHIKKNPFDFLNIKEISRHVPSSNYEIEPFNTEEKEAIINMATGQVKNFIQFAFWTGMRIGEIIALTWDDVDLKNEIVKVTKSRSIKGIIKSPKTKAGFRDVELTPLAFDAVKKQLKLTKGRQANNAVFNNPSTNQAWYSTAKFWYHWNKILKLAHVKYRNPHQMRHTFISHMLSLGNRAESLYKIVGHENTEMIYKVYGKFIDENKKGKILIV